MQIFLPKFTDMVISNTLLENYTFDHQKTIVDLESTSKNMSIKK